jgi:N-acetyltransferase
VKPVEGVVLKGSLVRLEPLAAAHVPGARFEGVLRNWSPSRVPGEEGKLRDNAMFSVTDAEWPGVKSALAARLAGGTAPRPARPDRTRNRLGSGS